MSQFGQINTPKVPMTPFDMSYGRRFSAEMGLVYPLHFGEVLPRDRWTMACDCAFRASPQLSPLLHKLEFVVHAFYSPTRTLHSDEQDWINIFTGGEDGDDATAMPTWSPSAAAKRNQGTLWDMLHNFSEVTPDADSLPVDYGRRQYMDIFNNYLRDVDVEPEIDWTQAVGSNQDMDAAALPTGYNDDEDMQYAGWAKDYFTSCRTSQELGDAETLPLSGNLGIDASSAVSGTIASQNVYLDTTTPDTLNAGASGAQNANLETALEKMTADAADATMITIHDFRLSLMTQRWKELNMRAGVRYPEYVFSQYGADVGDGRWNRPEWIGSAVLPVTTNEITYTAEGASDPVGTLTGKATVMGGNYIGKFTAPEHGWLMVLGWFRPKATYSQGIHRSLVMRDRYDIYAPIFRNLSEQAVLQREIYVGTVKGNNETVFGYIPAWDHYRINMDVCNGLLKPGQTFDYWHMSREFASAPTLSASFLRMHEIRDDAWAVPAQPHFFCHWQNILHAVRPMPAISTPGLL